MLFSLGRIPFRFQDIGTKLKNLSRVSSGASFFRLYVKAEQHEFHNFQAIAGLLFPLKAPPFSFLVPFDSSMTSLENTNREERKCISERFHASMLNMIKYFSEKHCATWANSDTCRRFEECFALLGAWKAFLMLFSLICRVSVENVFLVPMWTVFVRLLISQHRSGLKFCAYMLKIFCDFPLCENFLGN